MQEDEFLKVFDFEYTASQWKQIERVIDTQPGSGDKKKLREKLELLARQFRLVPQLEAHVPRRANLTQANAVVKCCERLKNLLSETNVLREGSFHTALKSRDKYDAIIDKIEQLENAAKLVAANNRPLSQKRRQADPRRDRYLAALCGLWVDEIHGKPTTSYRRAAGKASGPFVDFLVSAAQPVLKQFTPNGARRFIERWKKGMAV
jgi:hypothetical protein